VIDKILFKLKCSINLIGIFSKNNFTTRLIRKNILWLIKSGFLPVIFVIVIIRHRQMSTEEGQNPAPNDGAAVLNTLAIGTQIPLLVSEK